MDTPCNRLSEAVSGMPIKDQVTGHRVAMAQGELFRPEYEIQQIGMAHCSTESEYAPYPPPHRGHYISDLPVRSRSHPLYLPALPPRKILDSCPAKICPDAGPPIQ